jgi:PBSX family phage terminase large subunit
VILTPAQGLIAADTHRFRVIDCGRRFGKTTEAVEEIKGIVLIDRDERIRRLTIPEAEKSNILHMSAQDEYRARVNYWAETYVDARDIAWGMLVKELGPITLKKNEARLELVVRNRDGNKAIIKLRGWESVESVRGTKSDFDLYDEAAKYKDFHMYWQEVLRPTLSDYMGEAIWYSTPRGFNHFYDLYSQEKEDPDYKSFHFTSYDNPYLAISELEKAKAEMTDDRFAQEYLADFRKVHGLVYKEFKRAEHVIGDDKLPEVTVERIQGVDFGYTNPSAVLTILKDSDSRYYVASEWYKRFKTNGEIIEYARSERPTSVYPDPAEPDRIEEMRRAGLNVREVSKDVEAGIDSVRALFKQNRLFIHKSCVSLISELETYVYKDKKADQNDPEEPVKENDHACDALRYALFMNSIAQPLHRAKQWKPTFAKAA